MNILNSKSYLEHIEHSNCTIEIKDVNVNMNVFYMIISPNLYICMTFQTHLQTQHHQK